jgi:hypothetical protein
MGGGRLAGSERSVKGKDFPKRGKFLPIGTNRDRRGFALGETNRKRVGTGVCEPQLVFWTLGEQAASPVDG